MPVEYDSPYQKLWDAGIGNPSASVVVEVGLNDGRGISRLRTRFPQARIFGIDEHQRTPDYQTSFDELASSLRGVATLMIERSPLPFAWPFAYDFCAIDIGSDPDNNFANIQYWLKYKNAEGVLAVVVPRSTPERLERKEKLVRHLQDAGIVYQEVFNWFVF